MNGQTGSGNTAGNQSKTLSASKASRKRSGSWPLHEDNITPTGALSAAWHGIEIAQPSK
jgi:hypothetical protein